MKKVLFLCDGTKFSEGVFEFIRKLNESAPVLVTGLFLPRVNYASLWSYAAAAGAGPLMIPLEEKEERSLVRETRQRFSHLCSENGIAFRVHEEDPSFNLQELKKETRFADLAVIGTEVFYDGALEGNQYDYIRELLHSSECPVLLVPDASAYPEQNILAYDGSAASVYAIKQFAYLFPHLSDNETILVFAETDEIKDFPSRDHMIELVTQHYHDLTLFKLEADPRKYFNSWIMEKNAGILVSGSFSRSGFSQLFHKSFVSEIVREHRLPVFIAHR